MASQQLHFHALSGFAEARPTLERPGTRWSFGPLEEAPPVTRVLVAGRPDPAAVGADLSPWRVDLARGY